MTLRRAILQDNFNSFLEPAQPRRPARLTVQARVRLLPRDPSKRGHPRGPVHHTHLARSEADEQHGWIEDSVGNLYECRSWHQQEFDDYRRKFKRMVELSWNNQLFLLPPEDPADGLDDSDYLQFVSRPDRPAHVECALEVELLDMTTQAPITMEVVHLRQPQNHGFGSFQFLITDEDLDFQFRSDSRWPSLTFGQVTAAHELGHWLGGAFPATDNRRFLSHVDAQFCSQRPGHRRNNSCEYGAHASRKMAMMGVGNLLTDYEAQVWLTRVRRHTQALFGWQWIHRVNFNKGFHTPSARQRRLLPPVAAGRFSGGRSTA